MGAYLAFALVGGGLSWWVNHGFVFHHPSPHWHLGAVRQELVSLGAGATFAALVILVSRVTVRRTEWGRRLHRDLRPVAVGMHSALIVLTAALSSVGEELFFRSFLTPWLGVIPQALLFAVLHQVPGPSRWVWMGWAAVAGLALGGLYWATGTLSGPLLAHALINAVNLIFLRDHEPFHALSSDGH